MATAATHGARTGREPGRPVPPADPGHPVRTADGHVPGRARPDDRQHRDPDHRRRPARPVGAGVGHDGVPHHLDDRDAALRQALRHLRPQEVLHRGHLDLHRRARCCARSPTSMYELAGFRAFQGIGAGGLFTLALAIIGDIVSPRERARYQGYFLAVFGTSSVLGPVIGGFLAGAGLDPGRGRAGAGSSWSTSRSASPRCSSSAPRSSSRTSAATTGSTGGAPPLLTVSLVPLLTVAEQGRTWGWGSGRSFGCYVVGVLGVGRRSSTPSGGWATRR